jgi:hypothetical protein
MDTVQWCAVALAAIAAFPIVSARRSLQFKCIECRRADIRGPLGSGRLIRLLA